MTFDEFKDKVVSILEGKGYKVNVMAVYKNNKSYTGICFERGMNPDMRPLAHLEDYYVENVNVENAASEIESVINRTYKETEAKEFAKLLLDYNKAALYIKFALYNKDANEELLKDCLTRPFLDLVIVPTVMRGEYTCRVTKDIASAWKKTEEEIFAMAQKNVDNSKLIAVSVCDLLDVPPDFPMIVVNSEEDRLGTYIILKQQALEDIKFKCSGDFWLIPSSINEWLAVPVHTFNVEAGDIKKLVTQINKEVVNPLDKLSDSVYIYKNSKLEIAE